MAKNNPQAGTSPFAHLLGGVAALASRAVSRRAEEDESIEDEGPHDEDDAVDEDEQVDDEETRKGRKGRKGKKAEDDDDKDRDAEDDDDSADAEDDDDDTSDDEDDDDDKRKAKTAYRRGFAAANKRAGAIFASQAAGARPDLAAQLAFGSSMTAKEAIAFLKTASRNARVTLEGRMVSRGREARPGADGGRTATSFADRVAAAKKKAGVA